MNTQTLTSEEVKKEIELVKQEIRDKEAVLRSLLEQFEDLNDDEEE